MPGLSSEFQIIDQADWPWLDSLLLDHLKKKTGRSDRTEKEIQITVLDHGQPAGGVFAHKQFESVWIDIIAVDPTFQKHGIGRLLLNELEKRCLQEGISSICLSTQDYQAPGFYEKNGFILTGVMPDVPFAGTNRHYYCKKLTGSEIRNP